MAAKNSTSVITDDDVFYRKLLMDGMGDERRLNNLLRTFFTWCDSTEDSDEQIIAGHENILSILSSCEFQMTRSQQSRMANEADLLNYETLSRQIESNVKNAKIAVLEKKKELQQAKKMREQRQQYDALRKIISSFPARSVSEAKLQSVRDEIKTMTKRKQALGKTLESKQKKLGLLISTVHQVKESMNDPDTGSDSE